MTGADRVAITGIGAVSALGVGVGPLRDAMCAGRSGIRPLRDIDATPLVARHGGQALDFRPAAHLAPLPRYLQMAATAAQEALADSRIRPHDGRVALVFSTCSGPLSSLEASPPERNGPEARIHEDTLRLARLLGITGPIVTVATACAASAGAIGRAADLLRCHALDAVLVGGADAFSTAVLAGFDRLRTTSADPCAPFSLPTGLTLGEGAGFWVLEAESDAQARRASPHGFVLGHGLSNDAYHPTAPDPTGAGIRRCVAAAVADAGIQPSTLGFVSAHGSGTLANDRTESRAVSRAFHETPPPTGSAKAALGHTLGAAGILEATATLLAIGQGFLPPTLHFSTPRDGCTLDCVPNAPRATATTRFLSQNLAFHGHNAAIVLATPRDPFPGPRPTPGQVVLSSIEAALEVSAPEEAPSQSRPPLRDRLPQRGVDPAAALVARLGRQALAKAAVPERAADRTPIGLVLAQCGGASLPGRRFLERWHAMGVQAPDLASFPFAVPNAVAGTVARLLGLKGWSTMLVAGHGAGLESLACGADALGLGHADLLVVAACDALPVEECAGPSGPSAPVPPTRHAAASLVLERADAAASRGAIPLARVAAWDAGLMDLGPNADPAESLATLLSRTLQHARIRPQDVGACVLSGDPTNGILEAAARILPAGLLSAAMRPSVPASHAHATAPLLALATLLGNGPATAPILVASLSPQGEARVVVLVPLPQPTSPEAPHA